MLFRCLIAGLTLSALLAAEQPPCPADRPVDEIIAELNKDKAKKRSRNKNPLPDNVCIFGWCGKTGPKAAPPTLPGGAPPPGQSGAAEQTPKPPASQCDGAMAQALEAAHNADVGDFYFEQKNFRGALFRYQDAAELKPKDPAIHVRIGRAQEKLQEPGKAADAYKLAAGLASADTQWGKEARQALARLSPN